MLDVSTGSRAISLSPARSGPEQRLSWQRRRFPWKSIRQNWLALLSGGVLALAILAALFAPAIAPHDPNVDRAPDLLEDVVIADAPFGTANFNFLKNVVPLPCILAIVLEPLLEHTT